MFRIVFALLLMISLFPARADVLGVSAGIGVWKPDFDGQVLTDVDLGTELDLRGSNNASGYIAFEHPVPLLPNLRIAHTNLDDQGQGTINTTFTFQGETFVASQVVQSQIDATHTDATFYYEVLDIGGDLDVGLTLRYLNGGLGIDDEFEEVAGGLPMLYVRGKLGLPFTGTYITGLANGVSYSGNRLIDYSFGLGWETENFILPEIGVEAGYRRLSLDVDQDDFDVDVDVDFSGVYLQLTGHF